MIYTVNLGRSNIPNLFSIEDNPNDQGGWVRLRFARSAFDTDSLILNKISITEMYTIELKDSLEWIAAANTVAYSKSIYSVLVPTLKDSLSGDNGLLSYRIIAGMGEGNYVSKEVLGYSVDNLFPSVPQNVFGTISALNHVKLSWNPVPDLDFKYYKIFRSSNGVLFDPLSHSIDTSYIDNTVIEGKSYYFTIKAVDNSGNESDFSSVAEITVTMVDAQSDNAVYYYLAQNYPNPFNPQTNIKYGLVNLGNVKIIIYDILGHKVAELLNRTQNPGHHSVNWNGRNSVGELVSSGMYYYKLKTDNFTSIKKLLIIR